MTYSLRYRYLRSASPPARLWVSLLAGPQNPLLAGNYRGFQPDETSASVYLLSGFLTHLIRLVMPWLREPRRFELSRTTTAAAWSGIRAVSIACGFRYATRATPGTLACIFWLARSIRSEE